MKSYWSGVSPEPSIVCALYKKGNVDTETCSGKMPREHEVRIEVTLLQAKKCQRWPEDPQKLGGRHGTDFFIALQRNQTSEHLDLRFLAYRTVRQCISIVEASQHMVLYYGNPSKLIELQKSGLSITDIEKTSQLEELIRYLPHTSIEFNYSCISVHCLNSTGINVGGHNL